MTLPNIGAPAGEPESDELYVGTEFDEIASRAAAPAEAPKGPDLSVKLDGDTVPEEFRGLSLAEMLQRAKGQVEVIKKFGNAPAPTPAPEPAPAAPAAPAPRQLPQMSMEQFSELYDNDPKQALAVYGSILEQRMAAIFEDRLSAFAGGMSGTAEHQARQKYPDEFKVFDAEIKAASKTLDPKVLANAGVWDEMIAYIRGKHADRWVEHKLSQRGGGGNGEGESPRDKAARETLGDIAPRPEPAAPRAGGAARNGRPTPATMTAEQHEIARNLNVSPEEYCKHYI